MDQVIILLVLIISFIWLIGLTVFTFKTSRLTDRFMDGADKRTLKDALQELLKKLDEERHQSEDIKSQLTILRNQLRFYVQKVGIVRYNPFSDTGGEQSFVLTLLDGTDSGFVLTSLHSRGLTRWFVKTVKNGKGENFELSEEEKKSIVQAISGYQKIV
jgi:hypothetical protein